jgi:hypothetical protein
LDFMDVVGGFRWDDFLEEPPFNAALACATSA